MVRVEWPSRASANQFIALVRECEDDSLHDLLIKVRQEFSGMAGRLLCVLTSTRKMPLSVVWHLLVECGHAPHHSHLSMIDVMLPLAIADFELILSLWPKLADLERTAPGMQGKNLPRLVQGWAGVRFLEYWQSAAGAAALDADKLQRLRPIWESVAPTQAQRLPPVRACSLGWGDKQTVELVRQFVDTNGETEELVRELSERQLLTPALMNEHQGLVGGMLRVQPEWVAERLLSGEVTLVKAQASIAVLAVEALAAWAQRSVLTVQNVHHLARFVQELGQLAPATNAMHRVLGPLMTLIGCMPTDEEAKSGERNGEGRRTACRSVSIMYTLEDPVTGRSSSRVAKIPRRSPYLHSSTTMVYSFEAFLSQAIQTISLKELTQCHGDRQGLIRFAPFPLSAGFQERFYAWALAQLQAVQSSETLLCFIENWATRICESTQLMALWRRAIESLNSWTFLLNSMEAVVTAIGGQQAFRAQKPVLLTAFAEEGPISMVYDYMAPLAMRSPCGGKSDTVRCAQARLMHYWPKRFASEYGISLALALQKPPLQNASRSPPRLVSRMSHKLSETAEQVNDTLDAPAELGRVFAKHPTMEKTKTRDEFLLLNDWVRNLSAPLFRGADAFERMSALLCATWSDKGALQKLSEVFGDALLICAEATLDVTPLVRFLRKSPNLGSKKLFIQNRLETFAPAFARGAMPLATLHPLLQQASSASDLAHYLHALASHLPKSSGLLQVTGETAGLAYELLAKESEAETRVHLLRNWRFATPPAPELDEDVDAEVWETGTMAKAPPVPMERLPLALSTSASGVLVRAVPIVPSCKLYRRFGPRGHAELVSFVSGATPTQLRDLFLEGEGQPGARSGANRPVLKDWVELCEGVMREWQPPSCAADQVAALLEIIEWFPETFDRCAPLVFAIGDEEAARKLLTMHPLADLEALPRHLWPCVHWSACTEAQLLTLVEAGVPVPLDQIRLEKLGWETQQVLVDAQPEQVGACAEYAAKMTGPITSYLTRFFELLPNSTPMLLRLGDGLEEEERKVSGWNKMVHALLVSLRERIREGNVLHTEEQLVVFRGCSRRDVDSANSALLADLLEAKNVDPSHVASLVKFVLGERRFHQTVRDSALRAMMRLGQQDRDALHRNLLSNIDSATQLPLQVLSSLCVTTLAVDVLPLVSAQLARLSLKQWDALLTLIADANPMGGKPPHTYPRSLGAEFNERLLAKYLRLKSMDTDDPRYFLLFLACTPPERVPGYLLGLLGVQRHPLDELFLNALTRMSRPELKQLLEYNSPSELASRLEWVLRSLRTAGDPCELLAALMDVLDHPAYRAVQPTILTTLLQMPKMKELGLFELDEFRALFRSRLPRLEWPGRASSGARNTDERFRPLRALYVAFFRESWANGAPLDSAESLRTTLHLGEEPLSSQEVQVLGADLRSMRLLVELAPAHAIPAFGFNLLSEDPSFAKSLSMRQLECITQLTPKGLTQDRNWAVCRKVIGQVEPACALRLAISLVCHSRELGDLCLVEAAYKAVDSFTRKQVWLPNELRELWNHKLPDAPDGAKRTFGDAILRVVSDAVGPGQTMRVILEAIAWRPPPPDKDQKTREEDFELLEGEAAEPVDHFG